MCLMFPGLWLSVWTSHRKLLECQGKLDFFLGLTSIKQPPRKVMKLITPDNFQSSGANPTSSLTPSWTLTSYKHVLYGSGSGLALKGFSKSWYLQVSTMWSRIACACQGTSQMVKAFPSMPGSSILQHCIKIYSCQQK